VYLAGTAIRRIDRRGQPVKDRNFLVLFNAHHEAIDFVLPQLLQEGAWTRVLDTALDTDPFAAERYAGAEPYSLQGRSVALLVASADD
jgi:glycogen operon protein